jgi:catechol 2,3-dioxygenase-like lactoylglutathione lyase family enzyme
MLDHLSFSVSDYAESVAFYDATLKILGFERVMTFETQEHQVAGYGAAGKPFFWVGKEASVSSSEQIGHARGFHVAFKASTIEAIQAWYQKCLELGGKDNGPPGPRPEYHPGYYAAFIIDPNGWRIEAVLHHYKKETCL